MHRHRHWHRNGQGPRSEGRAQAHSFFRDATRLAAALLLALSLALPARVASAGKEHRSDRGGHPLRLIGYVLHPVGFLLDTILVRPAHWLVSREPLEPVFGHTDDT